MRKRAVLVSAVALIMLSIATLPAAAEHTLTESVIYAQGIGLDGFEVVPDGVKTIIGPASNVMLDWSDDIVFHQFPVGQKIRTEVILHSMNADGTMGAAVYTITAHLMIQKISDKFGEPVGNPIYWSSIAQGLWHDGPDSYYSAEVNSEGYMQ